MPSSSDDLDRLRNEYAARRRRLSGSEIYSFFNASYLFMVQRRQQETLALLQKIGLRELDSLNVLEIGCGQGGVLLEFLSYGARPAQLYGVDLLLESLIIARNRLPHLSLTCCDGQYLPYPAHSFDLLLQFTAFSSILDQGIKNMVANDMLRVLRPGGLILWYDFWLNPTNPQTRGIRVPEIRSLFPNCRYVIRRITLAPPIARRLVRFSWSVCTLLEKLRVLNTHYLVAITKL